MIIASNLGFPRIGPGRELKRCLERYWWGETDEAELQAAAAAIRRENWLLQKAAGIDHIPSNDFSLYDHVLDAAVMVGAIPERFGITGPVTLPDYFAMARGRVSGGGLRDLPAMEMTKWLDTNYHYIVPEFSSGRPFQLLDDKPVREFLEAAALGIHTRPVILGPFSLLMLGRDAESGGGVLHRLPELTQVYIELLQRLREAGATWVQMDEPCLSIDLDDASMDAFETACRQIGGRNYGIEILLTTYFADIGDRLDRLADLPVAGLHLDLVRAPHLLEKLIARKRTSPAVSLGIIDGRNVWRADLHHLLGWVEQAIGAFGADRVMIAPSCSLLHVPLDARLETSLPQEVQSMLSFAVQKLQEVATLAKGARYGRQAIIDELDACTAALEQRRQPGAFHDPAVRERVAALKSAMFHRPLPYDQRRGLQAQRLRLPRLPTTTIGSFPQTSDVRKARAQYLAGRLDQSQYEKHIREQIRHTLSVQEQIGLDVLVHGEYERTDMVEYFGAHLAGFTTTQFGWVQSYGSRCVKPPIIFGDVYRRQPITLEHTLYAQSLTQKPVKGMLTGPLTILNWSFVRDDQPRSATCFQIALAIRDEVKNLESAGISIIQIDEPTLREGLPLRKADQPAYLRWAVDAFRLAAAGASAHTQVHTHMCYCNYGEILDAVIEMDADVISLEAARSSMELLKVLSERRYPNEIGPGVYDIHSPRVPSEAEIDALIRVMLKVLRPEQLWINPDCGLKTRRWEEVIPALTNMVQAAKRIRMDLPTSGAPV
ncbi:MAG: 5-methyltetrahydropteroyltriglutamate--homocysteine S-methyltransferase [Phycisphaerae bacterium]